MSELAPVLKQKFTDSNGVPLAGGKVYTYAAGTTTPLATYTDSTEITPNTNPIILDSQGQADIWIGGGGYKFVLQNASGAVQWTIDNVKTLKTFSFDTVSPMNTLGDTIYGGVAGSGTRLPGNTSATKNFLTQTGSGAASAAPVWGTIAVGDVPTLNQNTSGSAASFTGSLAGDVTGTQGATVVGKINGTSLAGLATGILKNTTATGVPSIAVAGDFPTLNQNTNGNAATVTTNANLTGDVTSVGNATTIPANSITNAKAAQMAAHTFKGNNTGGTANAIDLTATQLTAELNNFVGDSGSGGTKGLVPAPSAGDAAAIKYLKADGTWATAAGTTGSSGINYISTNPNFETNTTGYTTYSDTQTVTITNASPAVFTVAATAGMSVGLPVSFTTSGGLPTGLTAGTTYYISTVIDGTTFNVSATLGGANVNTSSAGSGTHTFTPLKPVTLTSNSLTGLTFSRTTSTPLRNTGSGLLTQTNATVVAGQGVYYAFTADVADQAKALAVSFDYNADSNFSASNGTTAPNSGGAGDSDIEVFIYDVTNSALIPVSPQVITAKGANNFTFKGTFQTASNSTSYRLALHTSKTSAASTGYNFKFDNVFVGPQAIAYGPPVTDAVAYTPTISGFTTGGTNISFFWARRGDKVIVYGTATSGSTQASQFQVTLPSGLTIDTNKVPSGGAVVGTLVVNGSGLNGTSTVIANGGNGYFQFGIQNAASALAVTPQNTSVWAGNTTFGFYAEAPVTGWSSTLQMSQDTDTRIVTARISGAVGSTAANTTIVFPNTDYDTHGAYSAGTYTAPVSGYYDIFGYVNMANANLRVMAYVNGSLVDNFIYTGSTTIAAGGVQVKVNAGDLITIRASNTTGAIDSTSNFTISRRSGPSAIAATETVACVVNGQPANMTANNPIIFPTVVTDTHGAYSNSTGKYTCPAAGYYQINTFFVATTLTANLQVNIFKNGVLYNGIGSGVSNSQAYGSGLVQCNAGDTIFVSTNTSTSGFNATATSCNLSIARIR